ncbi:MAG: glutathione peroxidase [Bacteroidota bacterium]
MKRLLFSLLAVAALAFGFTYATKPSETMTPPPRNFYDLSVKSLDGKSMIKFSDFKGKKILCVNTASECGYTPQYTDLQKLSEKYKTDLVVIGFPCNQFGEQEPDDAAKIGQFCKARYGVTFLLTEKIDVKGEKQHDVYKWLTSKDYNKVKDVNVRWNFGKFLLDENGKLLEYFPSQVTPMDPQITALIEKK